MQQCLTFQWNPARQATLSLDRSVLGNFPYKDSGQEYTVRVTPKKKLRSIPHNRMYWGYFLKKSCRELIEHGVLMTPEGLHEELKTMFLTKRIKLKLTNTYKKTVGSTTSLSTEEFRELMKRANFLFMERYGFHVDLDITEQDLLYWESLFL